MSNSSPQPKRKKPAKPHKDFPLHAHASGQWCKNVCGNRYYFGVWADPVAAEARWDLEKGDLRQGKLPPSRRSTSVTPIADGDWCTMQKLCNEFCKAKQAAYQSDELSLHTFKDYHSVCVKLIEFFGKTRRVDDITLEEFAAYREKLALKLSASSLGHAINRARIVLKFASDQRLIAQPITFGQSFKRPSSKKIRKEKREAGKRLYSAQEVRSLLEAAEPQMKAIIWLGINCALGNTDVAELRHSNLDLSGGWLDYPRPKTESMRVSKLWPETIAALRALPIVEVKKPADKDKVFLTRWGQPWVRMEEGEPGKPETAKLTNTVALEFRKLPKKAGIAKRHGLGFYSLRHTFETIAQRANLPVATNIAMGHADSSMAAVYREEEYRPHLEQVAQVVHDWLFAEEVQP